MQSHLRALRQTLLATVTNWYAHNAPSLAAALSYYTIFSIAPLLIVLISVAGLLFGQDAVRGELVTQISGLVGPDGAKAIEDLIANASRPASGVLASLLGIAVIIFGAVGVLVALQDALNTIWEVPPNPDAGIGDAIRHRFGSLLLVLAIGFVLLVSLVISAVLAAANSYFTALIPGNEVVWMIINFIVALGVVTLLFAVMLKFLPNVQIPWSDVWVGAAATAILFSNGKTVVGLYLGQSGIGSTYGAAGSLVIVLVWVYYSAQIFFLGAELTRVYAQRHGSLRGRKQMLRAREPRCDDVQPTSAGGFAVAQPTSKSRIFRAAS